MTNVHLRAESPPSLCTINAAALISKDRRSMRNWRPESQLLAERVRDVVEGRIQLVADTLHGSDASNGNQSGNQAIFDRGCALVIPDQPEKRHGPCPRRY